ncbi:MULTISPECIES: flavodoxin family protein [Methanoculleus]|uniref:Transcriptional regulator, ArsR family n=2 Tax=Methanoculleus TaxID=45989 RepID=A3CXJ4_METMJ|nr:MULTISPECIES: flavodoxin [Methanoculleus]ABN58094.1 transcriptional regulator, ArsR family [Methanoculleus marisnigri JR1]UYU19478.1 NAD(P)H-dependent oxidoreductase [Methanoculleus submarinus]
MSVCIIYHSETGNTRAVAEQVAAASGGDLIGVRDLANYSKVGMYLKGARRAMRGDSADIEPAAIDVSGYETVVVGTPVWAGNPTPAINAAVNTLRGIEGKPTIVFCTSGGSPRKTLETLTAMLAKRGADVRGAVPLTARTAKRPEAVKPLVDLVRQSRREMAAQ